MEKLDAVVDTFTAITVFVAVVRAWKEVSDGDDINDDCELDVTQGDRFEDP
jgi:hypothetical protein